MQRDEQQRGPQMQVMEPMQPCCTTAQRSMHCRQAGMAGRQGARPCRQADQAGWQAQQKVVNLGGPGRLPSGLAAAARQPRCPGVMD
jgi:hypothetical protein